MDKRSLLIRIGLIAAGLALLGLLALGIMKLMSGGSSAPARAPKISLIPTTPPPPPPPPKEEKKPEPPKEQKEVRVEQAPPREAQPAPASADLKMAGPAGDGPSAFGAGKITREDLAGLNKSGGGGIAPPPAPVAAMFSPYNNYATLLKGELQRLLARNKELRQSSYRVDVNVWVGRDGSLMRHELLGSSGDRDIDTLIRQELTSMAAFSQLPPERMPQPIRLRLSTGRGTG